MLLALAEAEAAAARGEVPVGAILVDCEGRLLAAAGNRVETDRDPTAHAEMLVLRDGAARVGAKHLAECDLYVTLEPCAMCAAAIILAPMIRKAVRSSTARACSISGPPTIARRSMAGSRKDAPPICCAPFFAIDVLLLADRLERIR